MIITIILAIAAIDTGYVCIREMNIYPVEIWWMAWRVLIFIMCIVAFLTSL